MCRADFDGGPRLPSPRGPISHAVIKATFASDRVCSRFRVVRTDDALIDEDFQLALYCCYELHYQGFAGVSDDWEWNPGLLQLRGDLERAFEESLRSALPDESSVAASRGAGCLVATDPGHWVLSVGLAAAARDPISCTRDLGAPVRLPAEGS